MRLFFDTSVLVAALVKTHAAHDRAAPWLQKVRDGSATGLIAAHSIAELYAILTTLPVRPRIRAAVARRLIQEDVLGLFEVVALSEADYAAVVQHLSDLGVVGGATYDALLLHAAAKSNPDHILTLNERHFRRVYPALADKLLTP